MNLPLLRSLVLISTILCPWLSLAADTISPFQARYEVYGRGISMGEAVMSLEMIDANTYQMHSDIEPNVLASLMISGKSREQASGTIQHGVVRPVHYQRHIKTLNKSRDVQLDFDWLSAKINARYNQKNVILPLKSGIVDPLSLTIKVMLDLKYNRLSTQYTMADKTELKTWQIKNLGKKRLNTSLGQLQAIHIKQSTPGKTRTTSFWFAPELHYIPVRVVQHKKGKEAFRMEIQSVEK